MQADPAADEELRRRGVRVPALVAGDRVAQGWNPPAYAAVLGVPWHEPVKLSPAELAQRLDRILGLAERILRLVPRELMEWRPPERDRTIRQLGYHVFRLSLAFVDAMDRGHLPESWFDEAAPEALDDGPALARYGALVRARLAGWFQGASDDEYARIVDVYYGPQGGHELLERTTWHAGQHLRQLHVLGQRLEVRGLPALPDGIFAGLPLPDALW